MRSLTIFLIFGVSIFIMSYCVNKSGHQVSKYDSPDYINEYVGESSCKSCHEVEYDLWKGSHHDWAMKIATNETVIGDFNDHKVILDGVEYHFYKQGNAFMAKVLEIDGSQEIYTIDHTFGITPLQQYITEFGKGKRQILRATWDDKAKRWYHQYPNQNLDTNDWLHWTEGGQRWNTMCAECHSTDLKRNYFHETDSFHTTWSSINVSCEGCHGPGKKHAEWAGEKALGDNSYILNAIDQQSQIDQCAPCHSRRVKMTKEFVQGEGYEDQFILQTVTPEFYHPDGQIDDEDYVIGSFLQSKMYMNGVKCNDCHNTHSMELKMTGNELCMQCHEPKYDSKEHHFHELNSESAECINCHMTGKVYMGNDFRRDHSFRVPRPDQSVKYGTPNACTGCHTDKSDEWAAKNVINWYGDQRPEHYSDAMLLSTENQVSAKEQKEILGFIRDQKQPYLTRATAVDNYSFANSQQDFEAFIRNYEG